MFLQSPQTISSYQKLSNAKFFAKKFTDSLTHIANREISLYNNKNKIYERVFLIINKEFNNNNSLPFEDQLKNIIQNVKLSFNEKFSIKDIVIDEAFTYTFDTVCDNYIKCDYSFITRFISKLDKIISWNPFSIKKKDTPYVKKRKGKFSSSFNKQHFELFQSEIYELKLSIDILRETLKIQSYFFNPEFPKKIIFIDNLISNYGTLLDYFNITDKVLLLHDNLKQRILYTNKSRWDYSFSPTFYLQETDPDDFVEHYLYASNESKHYNRKDMSLAYSTLITKRREHYLKRGICVIDKINFSFCWGDSIYLELQHAKKQYVIFSHLNSLYITNDTDNTYEICSILTDDISIYTQVILKAKNKEYEFDKFDFINFNSDRKLLNILISDNEQNKSYTLSFSDRHLEIKNHRTKSKFVYLYESFFKSLENRSSNL